jgi:hypothetical protein
VSKMEKIQTIIVPYGGKSGLRKIKNFNIKVLVTILMWNSYTLKEVNQNVSSTKNE